MVTRHSFAPDRMRSPKPPLLTAAAALAPQVTLLTTKAKSPSFATWPMPGVPEDGAAGLPVVDFPVVEFPPGAATTMTIARMTNPRKPRELRTGCLRRSETAGPVLKGVGDAWEGGGGSGGQPGGWGGVAAPSNFAFAASNSASERAPDRWSAASLVSWSATSLTALPPLKPVLLAAGRSR